MANLPAADLQAALANVRLAGHDPNLIAGGVIILMKAWILAAMTMFISTFATSTIFTTITAFAAYFIGHLQATAREYWIAATDSGLLTKGALALISLIFPDLQAFNLADGIVAGTAIPLAVFWNTIALGGGYILVYAVLAAAVFHNKEL